MNSPIKWMGGKFRLRKTIVSMIPKHICYCEPFGGAGWVLFEKAPSAVEVYNDINQELVNFFKIIKNNSVEFIERTNCLLISRELFQGFRKTNPLMMTEVDRAVRFYYLLHFSFGARMKTFMITPLKRPPRVLERVNEEANLVREKD
ncbi:DNA adenine methylase [Desulfosporosinus sp. OT]|uniref:DNA adenine methylase n=1 Tax=Desulfosporosinus sp. OT TaxID=913865 RepID=UPI000223A914|nr:DNA adenine methylase [Desulfosporosinus sp. OT]EGW39078.1 putative site-specific DNA-methyltransferase [Desulfosporosinus sp. OT]